MQKIQILIVAGGVIAWLSLASYAQIQPERLPTQANKLQDFAPVGWQVEKTIEGDLNKDAVNDAVLVLIEALPANADKDNPPERQRALLALLKTADGKWIRAGVAPKLLLCTRCGGAFYGVIEAPVEIEIGKGVIVVQQEFGSRNVTIQTFRFRYDAATRKFGLIGLDLSDRDRASGEVKEESSNFLTGIKTATKSQMSEKGEEKILSNTRKVIAKTQKPMEAVNYEDYYVQ
jgi:hypothetical protein